VLTSDEAIGAYAFDWSQGKSAFQLTPPSDNPPLWQAWWIATADFSQMSAPDLNAFFSNTLPGLNRNAY
jgi:hypothetical protein